MKFVKMNVDSRGVARGCCNVPGCSCSCYAVRTGEMKCSKCDHPPGRHAKSSMTMPVPQSVSVESGSDSQDDNEPSPQPVLTITKILSPFTVKARPQRESPHSRPRDAWVDGVVSVPRPPSTKKQSLQRVRTCIHPNCDKEAFFDLNTGEESDYCNDHMHMPRGIVPPEDLHTHFSGAMFVTDGDSDMTMQLPPDQPQELLSLAAPSQIVFPPSMPAQPVFHPSQSTPNLSLHHQLTPTKSLPSAMPLAAMPQPPQVPVQPPQIPGIFSMIFTA